MIEVDKSDICRSFFRGENGAQFNPYKGDYINPNFLQEFVVKGWIPKTKLIKSSTNITAFGSCFVANIIRYLKKLNFKLTTDSSPEIYISRIGEGLANVYSLFQQFEWALENKNIPHGLWYGANVEEYGIDENIRLKTKDTLLKSEVFIFTLGVSEIWEDIETGNTFWRAIPEDKYDPKKHRFRVLSMNETKDTISKIYSIIKKHIPNSKVIFTVSPIPFAATFRQVSCVTASSAGKSILRASLDEFIRENDDLGKSLFYFPSFEIPPFLYDPYEDDGRHLREDNIKFIMKLFEVMYCDTNLTWEFVEDLFKKERNRSDRMAVKKLY
jgi:hypothetical protein